MEKLYKDHAKLIKKLAWDNSGKLNMTYQEALSEVHLVFCESARKYQPEKECKFSTFLSFCFKNHVRNVIHSRSMQKRQKEELNDFKILGAIDIQDTEQSLIFYQTIQENPVTKSIWELLNIYKLPKTGIKKWITKELLGKGFQWAEIWGGYKLIDSIR